MKALILASLYYYKLLLLFNIACTLLAIAIILFGVGANNLFLAKILGFAGAVMLHQYSAKETYYYFRNAGCRMRWVTAISFIADTLLFMITFFLINLVTHAAHFKG